MRCGKSLGRGSVYPRPDRRLLRAVTRRPGTGPAVALSPGGAPCSEREETASP